MVPRIASSGRSFKGAGLYYLHDKNASTRERVAWTHTQQMMTDDPDKAMKVMAFTAMHQTEIKQRAGVPLTGRKLEKPVFAFSVAWHPGQDPDKEHMLETAQAAVKHLGLEEHEVLYVAHRDEPHRHVHAIVNRVHPMTGKAAVLSKSKEKLQDWAYAYEEAHGKIYCPERVENVKKREQWRQERAKGNKKAKSPKFRDAVIVEAWKQSDSGKSFASALEEKGYRLAQGRKRMVVVDAYGKAHNPVRMLEGIKAKDFRARVSDLNVDDLPGADDVQRSIKTTQREEYEKTREGLMELTKKLNELQDRHIAEKETIREKFSRERANTKEELEEFHGITALGDEIAQLKAEGFKDVSLFSWLTGKGAREARRREERIGALDKQLENAQGRIQDQLGGIDKRRAEAETVLATRHEKEMLKIRPPERVPSPSLSAQFGSEARSGGGVDNSSIKRYKPDLDQISSELERVAEQSKQNEQDRGRGSGLSR